jgi:hypothetical protein
LFKKAAFDVYNRLRLKIALKNVKMARKAKAGKGWA